MGIKLIIDVDVVGIKFYVNDIFIFCFDGISGILDDDVILNMMCLYIMNCGSVFCEVLIIVVIDVGLKDNFLVIVVWIYWF